MHYIYKKKLISQAAISLFPSKIVSNLEMRKGHVAVQIGFKVDFSQTPIWVLLSTQNTNLNCWIFCFLMLYIPVNYFSVMSGRFPAFLGLTSIMQQIKCLAQEHKIVTLSSMNLELATILSPAEHAGLNLIPAGTHLINVNSTS